MKNKKTLLAVILVIIAVIVVLAIVFWPKTTSGQGLYLYISDTCPHCKIVEQFISDNGIAGKVQFQTKEVSTNPANAQELIDRATKCGIPSDQVGVPLLWNNSQCIVGDQPIIDFFKSQTGIK